MGPPGSIHPGWRASSGNVLVPVAYAVTVTAEALLAVSRMFWNTWLHYCSGASA
jgi:predicted pyridoxine 5'-phosphate oxidase superfamily flavin-nucleotide-binding protein